MGNQAHRPAISRLILVKHGRPRIVEDQPRSAWALSDEGRVQAAALAEKLLAYAPARLVASPEPKAYDTAVAMGEVLGLGVTADADLQEHRADHNPFTSQGEIEALIEAMLRDPQSLVMGEETGDAAHDRFAAAMGRIAGEGAGTTVVVAHGRIITLWLSRRLGFDPVPFWRRLKFTSAAVLSKDGATYEIVDS
jgi:probable phosphoglycerate mutase